MKTIRRVIGCGAVAFILSAVAGCHLNHQSAPEPPVAPKPTVQGRWSGYENGGTERITIEFTGDRFAYWDSQGKEIGSGTFKVNDTVQPNQLDLTFKNIDAPQYVGKVGLAVFEMQGNELKIAGAEPGTPVRPEHVAGGDGARAFVFQRE